VSPSGGVRSMRWSSFLQTYNSQPTMGLTPAFSPRPQTPRAIDVAVVGHGNRFLANLRHPRHQLLDVTSAVKQRVVGMVDEDGRILTWRVFYQL